MKKATEAQEFLGESAAKAPEALTVREGARLYADLLESTSQALLRAAEQAQASTLEAARSVQQSVAEARGKVQNLSTPGEK